MADNEAQETDEKNKGQNPDQEGKSDEQNKGGDTPSEDKKSDLASLVKYPHLLKDGDTLEDYVKKVEDAYGLSSTEGKRLASEIESYKDKEMETIANQKKDEKPSDDSQQAKDTSTKDQVSFGDQFARSELKRRNNEAFDKFVEQRPELQGEEAGPLRTRLKEKFKVYANAEFNETNEVPLNISPLLSAAWAAVKSESGDMEDSTNELKDRMGSGKTSNVKKRSAKSQFTDEQIATAQKLYPGKSREEIQEALAKHVK